MSEARPGRLRDERGDATSSVTARAGAIIRALPVPAPLTPEADARILAALRPGRSPLRLAHRGLVLAAALLLFAGTGFGARAAIEWMRRPALPAPLSAPPPIPAPRPARAIAPLAPARTFAVAIEPPVAPAPRGFVRAQRVIDPNEPAYRPQVPGDLARAHAGKTLSWRVTVCVSPSGAVSGASSNDVVHPGLDRQVLAAIRRWRYRPATRAGRPIRSCAPLRYELKVTDTGG